MKKVLLSVIVLIVFSGPKCFSQEKTVGFLNNLQISTLVDSLSRALKTYYTYPEKAYDMTGYLKAQLKRGVYKRYTDPTELAYRLETDIRHVHYDAHLHVVFAPGLHAPKDLSPAERERAYQEQLTTEKENNFNFRKAEILPGNIGYFRFDGFTGSIQEAKPIVTGALTFLSNTKALIIDLRFNGGGSTIGQFTSYFFKQKTHLYDQVSTFNKDTLALQTDPLSTNGLALMMPVYILTSKHTASAAEAFAASMQNLKRAVIIGDTSLGASHFTGIFPIGQSFIAKIPFARPVSTATFKDWEGVGVIPNIVVPASKALHEAQERIYIELLSSAKSEKEKRVLSWGNNTLKAEQSPASPAASILSNYTGTFSGGIHFYVESGNLFCKNPERGGTDVFQLKAISDHIFLLDENAQVEFVKDARGKYSSLNLLWKDGNITRKSKE